MNYRKIYQRLITNCQKREKPEGVSERHHIKPKCFGGSNLKDNLVYLTPKEHFIAHFLLVEIYPDSPGMFKALWCMCTANKKRNPSSRLYNLIRSEYIKNTKGFNNHMFGRKHTNESKELIRIKSQAFYDNGGKVPQPKKFSKGWYARQGNFKGFTVTEEAKAKIKASLYGGKCYKAKKVKCLITGEIFGSGREVSDKLKLSFSSVRGYLNKSRTVPSWFHYERISS